MAAESPGPHRWCLGGTSRAQLGCGAFSAWDLPGKGSVLGEALLTSHGHEREGRKAGGLRREGPTDTAPLQGHAACPEAPAEAHTAPPFPGQLSPPPSGPPSSEQVAGLWRGRKQRVSAQSLGEAHPWCPP